MGFLKLEVLVENVEVLIAEEISNQKSWDLKLEE